MTRLLKVVLNSMDTKPSDVTIAVDSQCTISATEKSGGLLAPYFASRISEAMSNLSEIVDETFVHPIQHVPGGQNPADIPTRDTTTPDEVREDSVWQAGPHYLKLDRSMWPFSRDFIDMLPEQELRRPKALFNLVAMGDWECLLGKELSQLVVSVMHRSNSYVKTVHVTARLLKAQFDQDRSKIQEALTVRDIKLGKLVQFMVSMYLSFKAMSEGKLDSLRPVVEYGIVYARGRCEKSISRILGVDKLPILARSTRLAELIMLEAHCENHRSNASDVLARSRQRAWIVRGRFLAKTVCKSCPLCRLSKSKLTEQLMGDIPDHQLYPCPPFTFVSLDFAGPYQAKAMGNSRCQIKLWGLVIICQNTRAIKMYATAGYSTDDFLTAYARFTSNHGNPVLVVSDMGSQLRKAGQVIAQGDPAGLD